jgi:hypothetical protein
MEQTAPRGMAWVGSAAVPRARHSASTGAAAHPGVIRTTRETGMTDQSNSAASRSIQPSRGLPRQLARIAEIVCLAGILGSLGAIVGGAVLGGEAGGQWALGGLVALFLSCVAPTWLVSTYDAIRAGQTATESEAARGDFLATWGLVGWATRLIAKRKQSRGDGRTK